LRAFRFLQLMGSRKNPLDKYKNKRKPLFYTKLDIDESKLERFKVKPVEKSYYEIISDHANTIYDEISQTKSIIYDSLFAFYE